MLRQRYLTQDKMSKKTLTEKGMARQGNTKGKEEGKGQRKERDLAPRLRETANVCFAFHVSRKIA